MKIGSVLYLVRDDLRHESLHKEFDEIKIHDFHICLDLIRLYDVIIFTDTLGTKIIKNEYGAVGNIEFS